jgi:hypothetical protein
MTAAGKTTPRPTLPPTYRRNHVMNKKMLLIAAALTLGGVATAQAATPATPAKAATAPAKKAPTHRHAAPAKAKAVAKKS